MMVASLVTFESELMEILCCESGGSALRILLWSLIMKDSSQALKSSSIFFKVCSQHMLRMMLTRTPWMSTVRLLQTLFLVTLSPNPVVTWNVGMVVTERSNSLAVSRVTKLWDTPMSRRMETFCYLMVPCNLNVPIKTSSVKAWRSTSMVDSSAWSGSHSGEVCGSLDVG